MNWVAFISFLNKVFPWVVTLTAYFKGKSVARDEINVANLEKEKEYAEIAASKPSTIDDDVSRMREGTF